MTLEKVRADANTAALGLPSKQEAPSQPEEPPPFLRHLSGGKLQSFYLPPKEPVLSSLKEGGSGDIARVELADGVACVPSWAAKSTNQATSLSKAVFFD